MESISEELAGGQVANTVKQALVATTPKFDEMLTAEFTYVEGGTWHEVTVNGHEYLRMLRDGEFEGRKLCAINVSQVVHTLEDGSTETVKFIYDFVLLHTGANPWRIA